MNIKQIQKAEQILADRDEAITLRSHDGLRRGRIVRLRDNQLALDLDHYMVLLDLETVGRWLQQARTLARKNIV